MSGSKKSTKKKVASSAMKAVSAESDSLMPKVEQHNINQLITQALLRYKNEQIVDKKIKHNELSHLASICEEYMSTFALIGYSLEDEKVVMLNMSNSKNEAALVDLLRSTFIEIISNRP